MQVYQQSGVSLYAAGKVFKGERNTTIEPSVFRTYTSFIKCRVFVFVLEMGIKSHALFVHSKNARLSAVEWIIASTKAIVCPLNFKNMSRNSSPPLLTYFFPHIITCLSASVEYLILSFCLFCS